MIIQEIYKLFLKSSGVVIDSRKVKYNDFFVALKGENFDANTFAKQALEQGALCVVIDNPDYFIDHRTILVEDSLQTLQQLANYHRRELKLPIIALTGSNGKTTTKELLHTVLSQKYNTKATVGNLNNHIGVPLTLLSFDYKTEIGIVEMGANHQKEIKFLCSIAEPNLGYITNFGKAHLEGFGGVEGVIKGKSELYQYLKDYPEELEDEDLDNRKKVFVNWDDSIQVEKSEGLHQISFSFKNTQADLFIHLISANPFVKVAFADAQIESHLIGAYNATNIAVAIAVGQYFKIDDANIKKAIESYIPANNRSQILEKNNHKIILDAYNANPSSMKVAIENFLNLEVSPKVMILGDMFELGQESLVEHKNIVLLLEKEQTIQVFFVGNDFYANKVSKDDFRFFESYAELSQYLTENKLADSHILIKGSRGMALERTLELL
jgi:UDP-N-acetylmuramoyl-tripeptide--D-alanyl-D-alanine ligase